MASLLDMANLDLSSNPNQLPPSLQAPPSLPSPIPTAQLARTIQGQHTELLIQVFRDRIFVVITQLGRIGALVSSRGHPTLRSPAHTYHSQIQVNPPPASMPSPIPTTSHSLFPTLPAVHPSTTLLPLFGAPPSPHASLLHDLYATQVGAICWQATEEGWPNRPVLLGIALRRSAAEDEDAGVSEAERECFGSVMEMIVEGCEKVGLGKQ